jgi:uncharacterized membrane protein YgcG
MFTQIKNYFLWRRIQNATLVDGDWENSKFIIRVAEKHDWRPSKVRALIEEYKKFLYIAVTDGPATPSKEVDEIWHEHILFTESYFGTWTKVLGRTLHHKPGFEGEDFSKTFKRIEDKKREYFGAEVVDKLSEVADAITDITPSKSYTSHEITSKDVGHSHHDHSSHHSHHDSSPSHHSCSSHSSHSCSSSSGGHSSCSSSSCGSSSCGGGGGCSS